MKDRHLTPPATEATTASGLDRTRIALEEMIAAGSGGAPAYDDVSDVPANTLLGNNTGALANAMALTASQTRTLLGLGTAALSAAGDFQPVDSDLTAIAALSTTSFGRSFLALADAAAGRSLLGLGTAALSATGDFQPIDADLTAIASLTTTSFGRGFLDRADAAAGRSYLGLGTAALSASGDFQPIDSDLTAIAALSTTSFGRGLLALADAAALTNQIDTFTSALKGLAPASGGGTSNFLRADGTWAAPSGGADPWTTLKLALDFTAPNSTTFTNISDGTTTLQFTPAANTDWEMEANIMIWTTATANLPRVGVNIPSDANRGYGAANLWQAGATATASVHANGGWNGTSGVTNVQIAAGGVLTASVPYLCEIKAAGRSGSAPTAITIQLACESAAANTCLAKRGSFLKHKTV